MGCRREGKERMALDTVGTICVLLDKRGKLFLEYEDLTQELLKCDVDDVEYYITQRNTLANAIDEVAEEIGRVCDAAPGGKVLFDAANARINFDSVPSELLPVFELGQNVRGIIARIGQTNQQVLERLQMFQNEARDKIRQSQNVPKIKKYLTDLGEKEGENSFTNNKA